MLTLDNLPWLVLAVLLAEIFIFARQPGRRARLLPASAAGAGLVAAWIASRYPGGEPFMLAGLAVGLGAHVVDLRLRW